MSCRRGRVVGRSQAHYGRCPQCGSFGPVRTVDGTCGCLDCRLRDDAPRHRLGTTAEAEPSIDSAPAQPVRPDGGRSRDTQAALDRWTGQGGDGQ